MADNRKGSHSFAADCIYTALTQLMKTMPYKDITITDITNKAGVSRMAYYRNYKDKDDILVKHVEHSIYELEQKIINGRSLTEEKMLREFISDMQNDMFVENIIQAGLSQKMFDLYQDFLTRIYTDVFDWDIKDENTVLLIYRKIGCLFGYMMYMNERKQMVDTDVLVKHLISLADEKY